MKIKLLDCTLRDGAYITESFFGTNAIKGIISNLIKAKINMIEVGWLKNNEHKEGSTYYKHVEDIIPYLPEDFSRNLSYIAMIDYGRYDLDNLSEYNGKSINTSSPSCSDANAVTPHTTGSTLSSSQTCSSLYSK